MFERNSHCSDEGSGIMIPCIFNLAFPSLLAVDRFTCLQETDGRVDPKDVKSVGSREVNVSLLIPAESWIEHTG
jgi:hypothetical protein